MFSGAMGFGCLVELWALDVFVELWALDVWCSYMLWMFGGAMGFGSFAFQK